MHDLIKKGKIKVRETFYDGFENMAAGFIGMLKGENFGKAIIRV